jgi:hypothetical protein
MGIGQREYWRPGSDLECPFGLTRSDQVSRSFVHDGDYFARRFFALEIGFEGIELVL